MFEKTLSDVIRGIRANPENLDEYIQTILAEARREVSAPGTPPTVFATAVLKLAYLHMSGYSCEWAAFHIIKAMSLPVFWPKWVGYLAASLSFTPSTDVLLLAANTIKKDLNANSAFDTNAAVACLADIVTPELAADLVSDLAAKANHFNPYTRRRVLLALYRTAAVDPSVLDVAVDKLTVPVLQAAASAAAAGTGAAPVEAGDPTVVACCVSVLCELAQANPAQYLDLAPHLYGLVTTSSNNWMLIKLVKVFARFAALEPRLARKLIPALSSLIATTRALSLKYECVAAALAGGLTRHPTLGPGLAVQCRDTLQALVAHRDPNLRYVALCATLDLVQVHPDLVSDALADAVFECLDAGDATIRDKAAGVLAELATPANLGDVVAHLMRPRPSTSSDDDDKGGSSESEDEGFATGNRQQQRQRKPIPSLDRTTAAVVLDLVTRNGFALVTDLEWLVSVLVALAHDPVTVAHPALAAALASALCDLCLRGAPNRGVPSLRPLLLAAAAEIIAGGDRDRSPCSPMVWAAALWIAGECCSTPIATAAIESSKLALGSSPTRILDLLVTNPPNTRGLESARHVWVQAVAKAGAAALVVAAAATDARGQSDFAIITESVMDAVGRFEWDGEAGDRAQMAQTLFQAVANGQFQAQQVAALHQVYFGSADDALEDGDGVFALAPLPLPTAPTPPFDLDEWISPDSDAFFSAPPEPLGGARSAEGDDAPRELPFQQDGASIPLPDSPDRGGSPTSASSATKLLANAIPPPPLRKKESVARSVLKRGGNGTAEAAAGSTAVPTPLLGDLPATPPASVSSADARKPRKSKSGSKKPSHAATATVPAPGLIPPARKLTRPPVAAEVRAENDDMSLHVTLAPPRLPAAPAGTTATATVSSSAAFIFPLTVKWAPKHALGDSVQLHVECPSWTSATGTQAGGSAYAGLLLPSPTAAPTTKLVLIKLRRSDAAAHLATFAEDPSSRCVVVRAVGPNSEVWLQADILLTAAHLLADPNGGGGNGAMTPDAFESELTSATASTMYPAAASATIPLPPHLAAASSDTLWPLVATAARMQLVQVVGDSASLWGHMDGGGERVAGMAKRVGPAEIRVQFKARERWVAEGMGVAVAERLAVAVV